MNAPEEDGMTFPKEKDDVSSKFTMGPLDHLYGSLEKRTMMLRQGDRQKVDIGPLSRLYKNKSRKELREWGDVGTWNCDIAPHEDVHTGLASCMMPARRHSDEHPALRDQAKHDGELPSFCGHVEWLGYPDSFLSGKEAQGLGNPRAFVSKPDPNRLGAARSKYIAGGSHSVCHCVSSCHVQSPTSEGIDSCGLPQLTRTLEVSGLSPPGVGTDGSTCSGSQTGELSKTNLLVRKTGSVTFERDFSEDTVVMALIQRGHQIEAELERRRSLVAH